MKTIRFKANDRWIETNTAAGQPALDMIRNELGLTSTKEGCREGDCGACAVMVGEVSNETVWYRAVPSCLLATGDLEGKHLITLEGLRQGAPDGLTPVMRAFLDENASQCGFCTPGFIIALTSWLAEPQALDLAGALRAVDGNLCRCTGYAAIRRAAARLAAQYAQLPQDPEFRLRLLVREAILPASVISFVEEKREALRKAAESSALPQETGWDGAGAASIAHAEGSLAVVGGGTDYYVRNPDPDEGFAPLLTRSMPGLSHIRYHSEPESQWLEVGAAVTVRSFFESPLVRREFQGIERYETAFASTLIRNLATVGGNIVNASPVGDIVSMLMALGARLVLAPAPLAAIDHDAARTAARTTSRTAARTASRAAMQAAVPGTEDRMLAQARIVPIEDFFLAYKKINLRQGEILAAIRLPLIAEDRKFSFEKISKRKNLDIAAVNTAIFFTLEEGRFRNVRISLGGVAPTPILGREAMAVLEGAPCPQNDSASLAILARRCAETAAASISPIDDVRGSAEYRRRMVRQLMLGHFIRLFESTGIAEELFP